MSRPNASTSRRLLWSRWLVFALLSLTLPLQGALAATMGIGMALMSAQSDGVVMTMPTDCHEMAGMDMSAMDMDGMAGMDHHAPGAHQADAASTDAATDHASDHHCGICLQCCIGAAMPIAPLDVAAQDLRDVAPSLRAVDAPDQSPQPLERPPKAFLA